MLKNQIIFWLSILIIFCANSSFAEIIPVGEVTLEEPVFLAQLIEDIDSLEVELQGRAVVQEAVPHGHPALHQFEKFPRVVHRAKSFGGQIGVHRPTELVDITGNFPKEKGMEAVVIT